MPSPEQIVNGAFNKFDESHGIQQEFPNNYEFEHPLKFKHYFQPNNDPYFDRWEKILARLQALEDKLDVILSLHQVKMKSDELGIEIVQSINLNED